MAVSRLRSHAHARRSAIGGVVLAVCVAVVFSACAKSSDNASPAATTTASISTSRPTATQAPLTDLGGCVAAADATLLRYQGASTRSDVAIMGDGPTGVVISYEVFGSVCPWLPLADRLAADGHTVVLYNRVTGVPADYPVDITQLLRDRGIDRVTLVGGSLGGMASIRAATTIQPPVDAVVALSGADSESEQYAPRLTVPLLQIVARGDVAFAQAGAAVDAAATSSPDHQLVTLDGTAHASEIFNTPDATAVLDRIVAFIDTYAGA